MSAPASKQAVPTTARYYKSYLTPEMHRKFGKAFAVTTLNCYLLSILQGDWTILFWFPFGKVGIRTITLLVPALFVYIIRVEGSHVGERTSSTISRSAVRIARDSVLTWLGYAMSAAVFAESYVWWVDAPNMGAIARVKSQERSKINERPVYIRCMLILGLATTQTFFHIAQDYNKINLTGTTLKIDPWNAVWREKTMRKMFQVISRACLRSVFTVLASTIIYGVTPIRYVAWRTAYTWNYMWVANATRPGPVPGGLAGVGEMLQRAVYEGFLLVLLWEGVNLTFNYFVNEAPLKKGKPLTMDSKDPNGTLVTGLRSRQELTRSFAFWELSLITKSFEERRKLIFDDNGRDSYKRISDLCIGEISGISKRIEALKPAPPPPPQAPPKPLPKISSKPISLDNVFDPNPPATDRVNTIGYFAQRHGSTPQKSVLVDPTQRLIAAGEQARATAAPGGSDGLFKSLFFPVVSQPHVGPYLRRPFADVVKATIFGRPQSRAYTISHAISSLSQLAVRSLQEDKFGKVALTVPAIVRTFVATINDVKAYVRTATPHWTDVEFTDASRQVAEVNELLEQLRVGLETVLIAHAEFLTSEGLGSAEIREAKALAGSGAPKDERR